MGVLKALNSLEQQLLLPNSPETKDKEEEKGKYAFQMVVNNF